MVEQTIRAIMIVEVAGRPPEYLKNSLAAHIEKLNAIKGVTLIESKMAEPKFIDEKNDLYTMFSEVEFETAGLFKMMEVVFEFMPSSVEILEPLGIELNSQEATMFLNDLAGRLHRYDEVAKIAKMQIQQLAQKLQGRATSSTKPNPAIQK